jgi:hypothetical protein
MKKLILAILLVALPLGADVVITNSYTDGQAARITRAMKRVNKETCAYFGLPADCTTTQARTVFCERNGNGAVSDCPGATQFIVYPNITLFDKRVLLEKIAEWTLQDAADDAAAAKASFDAKTQAQKDAICTSLGLAAGCTPWQ